MSEKKKGGKGGKEKQPKETPQTSNQAVATPTVSNETEKPQEIYSLEIFRDTKISQTQHGLRHGDYQRYRQYCSRRLRRIRKSLNILTGKNRYQRKTFDAKGVIDKRFLLIVLVQAERSWGYAMELKETAKTEPRARFHMSKKFAKAAFYATHLKELCETRADNRTKLEAEAYCSLMSGNLKLEKEQWKEALVEFKRASTIFEQLGKVGDQEFQEICRQRLEEIAPNVRFCNYNLQSQKGGIKEIQQIEEDINSSDLLKSKLEAVISDTLKKRAETLHEINWRGKKIPVKSEKLRVAILSLTEIEAELQRTEADKKVGIYDKLFLGFAEASRIISEELKSLNQTKHKTSKAEQVEESLNQAKDYLAYLKLTKTLERNVSMAESLEEKLDSDSIEGKKTKPEDVVRVYEILIQNVTDLSQLKGPEDPEETKQLAAKLMAFKAIRCYFLGVSYYGASKFREALSLLERASSHIRLAISNCESSSISANYIEKLRNTQSKIGGLRSQVHASQFMEAATQAKKEEKKAILARFKAFESTERNQLISFPPEFEAMTCKPIFFDLAGTHLDFPNLDARKKGKGLFSFW